MGLGWVFGIWWGLVLSASLATVALGLWPRRRCPPARHRAAAIGDNADQGR